MGGGARGAGGSLEARLDQLYTSAWAVVREGPLARGGGEEVKRGDPEILEVIKKLEEAIAERKREQELEEKLERRRRLAAREAGEEEDEEEGGGGTAMEQRPGIISESQKGETTGRSARAMRPGGVSSAARRQPIREDLRPAVWPLRRLPRGAKRVEKKIFKEFVGEDDVEKARSDEGSSDEFHEDDPGGQKMLLLGGGVRNSKDRCILSGSGMELLSPRNVWQMKKKMKELEAKGRPQPLVKFGPKGVKDSAPIAPSPYKKWHETQFGSGPPPALLDKFRDSLLEDRFPHAVKERFHLLKKEREREKTLALIGGGPSREDATALAGGAVSNVSTALADSFKARYEKTATKPVFPLLHQHDEYVLHAETQRPVVQPRWVRRSLLTRPGLNALPTHKKSDQDAETCPLPRDGETEDLRNEQKKLLDIDAELKKRAITKASDLRLKQLSSRGLRKNEPDFWKVFDDVRTHVDFVTGAVFEGYASRGVRRKAVKIDESDIFPPAVVAMLTRIFEVDQFREKEVNNRVRRNRRARRARKRGELPEKSQGGDVVLGSLLEGEEVQDSGDSFLEGLLKEGGWSSASSSSSSLGDEEGGVRKEGVLEDPRWADPRWTDSEAGSSCVGEDSTASSLMAAENLCRNMPAFGKLRGDRLPPQREETGPWLEERAIDFAILEGWMGEVGEEEKMEGVVGGSEEGEDDEEGGVGEGEKEGEVDGLGRKRKSYVMPQKSEFESSSSEEGGDDADVEGVVVEDDISAPPASADEDLLSPEDETPGVVIPEDDPSPEPEEPEEDFFSDEAAFEAALLHLRRSALHLTDAWRSFYDYLQDSPWELREKFPLPRMLEVFERSRGNAAKAIKKLETTIANKETRVLNDAMGWRGRQAEKIRKAMEAIDVFAEKRAAEKAEREREAAERDAMEAADQEAAELEAAEREAAEGGGKGVKGRTSRGDEGRKDAARTLDSTFITS